MKMTSRLLLAPLLLATAAVSPAASILIDFGLDSPSNRLSPTEGSEIWNNYSGADSVRFTNATGVLLSNMLDSEGVETTVDLRWVSASVGGYSAGINGGDYNVSTETGYPLSATRDFLFLNDGSGSTELYTVATLELNGLESNGLYNLTFFAGLGGTTERGLTMWEVNGEVVSVNPLGNTEAVTLYNVQADADGNLQILWSNDSTPGAFTGAINDTAVWNTLEITPVPEASSAVLAASALLGGCFVRRRRA